MNEIAYIPCRHGVIWRVVNPWVPSFWRKGEHPNEHKFVCPCDRGVS